MALIKAEGEQQKPVPQVWIVVQNLHPLSGSVWLCLALTFVDSQDAFCTKDVVAPRTKNSNKSDNAQVIFPTINHFLHSFKGCTLKTLFNLKINRRLGWWKRKITSTQITQISNLMTDFHSVVHVY